MPLEKDTLEHFEFNVSHTLRLCGLHEHRYVTYTLSTHAFLLRLCSLSLILNYWSNLLGGQRVRCLHSSAFNRSLLKYLTVKRETKCSHDLRSPALLFNNLWHHGAKYQCVLVSAHTLRCKSS